VDFSKGAYASAILAAKKLAESTAADDKSGVGPKATAAAAEWTLRATARVERLKYMLENAQFAKADAEVLVLKPAIKGLPDLEAKLADYSAKLVADDQKVAREAAKALDGLLAKINDKGPDDKTSKELKKLAEKYPGTKPGERAGRLAQLLDKKPATK
jgi:flagellar motility protein MotE (MotC chaperone)